MNIVKMAPIKRKNPRTGKMAWYLQKRKYDTISSKELVEAMARNTGIPVAKVAMATDAIVKQLKNFLLNGHSVNIIGLGTFSPRIKSRPSTTKDAVTADNVKALLLKFRPQTDIREDMKNTVGYEVIHSEVTGTAPAPAPEDPYLGVLKYAYYFGGALENVDVERKQTATVLPMNTDSTFLGLKTDGTYKNGKFAFVFTKDFNPGTQIDPNYVVELKRATGALKKDFDYVANGVDISRFENDENAAMCMLVFVPNGVKIANDTVKPATMINFTVNS